MVLPIAIDGIKSLATPFVQPLFLPLLYYTLQALGTILSFWTKGDRVQDEQDQNPLNSQPYDFIIVGAGSAGSLLANRLSRTHNVLLLEAGGEPNPLQFIPGFSLFLLRYPEIDWAFKSVPQKYGSLISVNQESSWSAGLGLGGSGTLNLMIHLRGHRRDFDNWANVLEDAQWSWEGVLPFFKSYESYEVPGDNLNHGYSGELRIEAPAHIGLAREFVRAGGELGYPNVDLNAPFVEGFDVLRYPIRSGVRQAPFKAFIQPIRFRTSLTIRKFARVTKVLFRDGNIAYGVEYDRHGRTYIAQASHEVIISGGSINTPKILMLSGVGPRYHLEEHNIPVISDLPVGDNLQDHLGVYLNPFFITPGRGLFFDRDYTPSEFVKYFSLGRGILTSTGAEATGIISSDLAKARGEGNWPDIVLFSYSFTNFRYGAQRFAQAFGLKLDELSKYYENDNGRDSLYVGVQGSRPLSRGYIRLGGSSPYDNPIIEPNYLGDPEQIDLKVLIDGVKKTVFIMENTTAIGRDLAARFTTVRLPGCEHLEFRTDSYWECYIRRYTVSLHHPVGTASMGSVVDTELRVKGVYNLRVVDASVQPVIVTTNTQASTLMIAEKAADMILKYWKNQQPNLKGNRQRPVWNGLGSLPGNGFWKNIRGSQAEIFETEPMNKTYTFSNPDVRHNLLSKLNSKNQNKLNPTLQKPYKSKSIVPARPFLRNTTPYLEESPAISTSKNLPEIPPLKNSPQSSTMLEKPFPENFLVMPPPPLPDINLLKNAKEIPPTRTSSILTGPTLPNPGPGPDTIELNRPNLSSPIPNLPQEIEQDNPYNQYVDPRPYQPPKPVVPKTHYESQNSYNQQQNPATLKSPNKKPHEQRPENPDYSEYQYDYEDPTPVHLNNNKNKNKSNNNYSEYDYEDHTPVNSNNNNNKSNNNYNSIDYSEPEDVFSFTNNFR